MVFYFHDIYQLWGLSSLWVTARGLPQQPLFYTIVYGYDNP